jgi:diadenosine tetraphosphate (Ap4A) HIT family hydrolase
MSTFSLHTRLATDCHTLGRMRLSQVLLHRNAMVPWLILVPEVEVTELCDLTLPQRSTLDAEIDCLCVYLRSRFPVTKLNVAAIGNLVPQLHVHVIGRHEGDPCWPGVVWGNLDMERPWTDAQVREIRTDLGL